MCAGLVVAMFSYRKPRVYDLAKVDQSKAVSVSYSPLTLQVWQFLWPL
jgi:predicted histidine transporter YuiF (NhaC family)